MFTLVRYVGENVRYGFLRCFFFCCGWSWNWAAVMAQTRIDNARRR